MTDLRFAAAVILVAAAILTVWWLLMAVLSWLSRRRYRKLITHTGRHVKHPDLPVLEGRGERAGWWPWSRGDEFEDENYRDGRDVIQAVEAANEDVPRPGEFDDTPADHIRKDIGEAGPGHPDVPGVATPPLDGPGYTHDDATAEFIRYEEPPPGTPVLLPVQGQWLPVSYEPPADLSRPGPAEFRQDEPPPGPGQPDDTLIDIRDQPRAGPAAWHPARPPLQPWIQACLGAPTVDAWAWGWAQKQRLAISA